MAYGYFIKKLPLRDVDAFLRYAIERHMSYDGPSVAVVGSLEECKVWALANIKSAYYPLRWPAYDLSKIPVGQAVQIW